MIARGKSVSPIVGLFLVSLVLVSCAPTLPTPTPTQVASVPADVGTTEQDTPEPKEAEPTPAPMAYETLRINLSEGFPDIIDPQKSSFLTEFSHLLLMYEGLTALNAEGEVIPGAAERWKANADASEWTFYVREGLKYRDGTLLNAKRFEYAILRNIDPDTAGEYAYITDEIAGAEEWRYGEEDQVVREGEKTVRESVKAYRLDGTPCESYDDPEGLVLKVKLSRPAPYYDAIMALWVTYPVKEEILDEGGEDWWINPQYHVGNGPYIMTELEPNVRARFEPSPSYHRGLGKVAIEFSYITESAVAFQAYRNDEFDIVTTAVEDLETIKADPELSKEYLEYAGSCTMGFIFHRGKEPFNDPKVRQAFSMALDRESYVRDVRSGLGLPTLTWIPDGMPGHQAGEQRWGYDPEAARKALADSSYGGPENLPKVVDSYPDTSRMRLRHEWLAAQWKQVLGVDVELDPVEPTSYAALTKDKSTAPQLFLLGWCADYPDPQTWLSSFWKTGAHAYEMVGFSDPDLDALLEKADSTLDRERRMELYDEAQDLIIDDCPGAFMFHTVQAFLVKPWVKGCKPNPLDFDWPGSFEPLSIEIDASLKPQ